MTDQPIAVAAQPCAGCGTPTDTGPVGTLCPTCAAKLQAVIVDPTLPLPTPEAPRAVESGPLDVATHADMEKEPELEKALEEAKAEVAMIHANYCKTKAAEPEPCSCGADPSVPAPAEEPAPAAPRAPDPVLMPEAEVRAITCVDIMGNGVGYAINLTESGKIIPYASGLQVAFTPTGIGCVFGVPVAFLDGPEVDPTKRRIQVMTVRCSVRKMLMCTRPTAVRLKNKADAWWGSATALLHTLPDTDRFDWAPAAPPAPAPAGWPESCGFCPESPCQNTDHAPKEAADGEVDPPAPVESQP